MDLDQSRGRTRGVHHQESHHHCHRCHRRDCDPDRAREQAKRVVGAEAPGDPEPEGEDGAEDDEAQNQVGQVQAAQGLVNGHVGRLDAQENSHREEQIDKE